MEHPSDAASRRARDLHEGLSDLTAVIPAGGVGTRLWPLSRQASPKFLHDLTGQGRSLLQATADRLSPLVQDRVMVVTGSRHADAVRAQLPELLPGNLVLEPAPRDSMPAIGLAAALLERRDPDSILGSFPADHVIGDPEVFGECVRQAVVAARTGALVTLGIRPTYPATGFGYLKLGRAGTLPDAPSVRHVDSFVEKPERERAQEYLDSGDHLWNAGIFVARAATLLDLLAVEHPEMARVLRQMAAAPGEVDQLWGSLGRIAIDHAVAEPAALAGRVVVVPADFPWDDVGDFASLATLLQESLEHPGLRVLGADTDVINEGSTGVVAAHGGRTIVTLGVEDIVVVDTPDALLVTTRTRCQDVRSVVDTLQRLGREDLT